MFEETQRVLAANHLEFEHNIERDSKKIITSSDDNIFRRILCKLFKLKFLFQENFILNLQVDIENLEQQKPSHPQPEFENQEPEEKGSVLNALQWLVKNVLIKFDLIKPHRKYSR